MEPYGGEEDRRAGKGRDLLTGAARRRHQPATRGEPAAAAALQALAGARGGRYPAIVRLRRAHRAEFTPFPAFPPEVRRVIDTTNLTEPVNARLRKLTRHRGQFPSEQAALKVPCPAVPNPEEFRATNAGIRSSG